MIRRDLEAAGIPYETKGGIFDFHAFRGAFISRVERSEPSVKTLQILARHARASMTDVAGAVESLPSLGRACRPLSLPTIGPPGETGKGGCSRNPAG